MQVLKYERRLLARNDSAIVANKENETEPPDDEMQTREQSKENECTSSYKRLAPSPWSMALSNTTGLTNIVEVICGRLHMKITQKKKKIFTRFFGWRKR